MPEVNTARVRRSGVRATSPALLLSFSQWNKPLPTPEDAQTQNMPRLARTCCLLHCTCALALERLHFLQGSVGMLAWGGEIREILAGDSILLVQDFSLSHGRGLNMVISVCGGKLFRLHNYPRWTSVKLCACGQSP